MKKSMETKQWCQQLRRSVALALLVSGGAAAVLPGTAGATPPWDSGVSGKESIVTSAEKEVTSAAVSGGELTLTSDAANVRGGYSYALSTYTTDATGAATSGDANGNTLRLSSNTNSDTGVYGGLSLARATGTAAATAGNALGNTVTVQGGTYYKIYGGMSQAGCGNNTAVSGDASDNMVLVSNSTFYFMSGGLGQVSAVSGSAAAGSANHNTVTVIGNSKSTGNVYGGYLWAGVTTAGSASTGTVDGNTVTIADRSTNNVINGGYNVAVCMSSGSAVTGEVKNNVVNIQDAVSLTQGSVIGGSNAAKGTTAQTGEVSNNVINISGSPDLTGAELYGGYAKVIGTSSVTLGEVADNVINISGTPTLTDATLYGGYWEKTLNGITTTGTGTGNTLNLYTSGLTANNIKCFQKINFYLPATIANGTSVLTLTDPAGTDISGVAVQASGSVSSSSSLGAGDTITLLTNANGLTTTGTTYGKGTITKGVSIDYDLTYQASGTALTATLTGGNTLKEQTKSFAETRAGAAAFLNSQGDMLSSTGIANAVSAAQAPGTGGSFTPFAAFGAANMRANSGSYVDSHGVNLNVGFSRSLPQADGTLTYGPLVEYGTGSYDSYLDDGTHGRGNTHSFGIGAFVRKDKTSGLWYEGSLRAGRITSDYDGLLNSGTTEASYDTSTPYYALHLGLGRIVKTSPTDSVDVYGKYFYTRQNGTSADLSTGEHYDFSAVNSSRLRLGSRYTHAVTPASSLYAGLAYEYEFAGDAQATYNGMSTPSPSLKGGSGFAELGWRVKPVQQSPLTLDLGLSYWQGKHEGLALNAGLDWKF